MARILLTFLLLGWTSGRMRGADPIEFAAAAASPPYRYLFVLDVSSTMSRQKETAIDTIHKLILGGLGGRIQPGDTLGIWTFSDTLHTNGFPPEVWVPENREDIANRAYRWLREVRFSKKGDLRQVVPAIHAAAAASGSLTAFLITDGTKPLVGTGFEGAVNPVFGAHAEGMKKARKPFVLALVAVGGRLAAHGLSPAGDRIYVPNVGPPTATNTVPETASKPPKPSPPATPTPQPEAQPKTTLPETPVTALASESDPVASSPPPKTLSVEEIAALMKKSDLERAKKAAAAEPPAVNTTVPTSAVAPSDPAPSAAPSQPPATKLDTTPPLAAPAATVSQPSVAGTPVPHSVPTSDARPPQPAPSPAQLTPAEAELGALPNPEPAAPSRAVSPPGTTAPSPSPVPAVPLAVAPPGGLSADAKLYLVLAIVFLLVACVFGYLLFRRPRTTVGPSLISRMMEQEKDEK